MRFLLLFTLLIQLLLAAPAFNGKRTFTQPDGETIEYRLQGDEYLHWLEADDGSLMLYNKESQQLESLMIDGDTIKPSGKAIHKTSEKATSNRATRSLKKDATVVITKETLLNLQQERRVKRNSKMKKRPTHKHNQHQ